MSRLALRRSLALFACGAVLSASSMAVQDAYEIYSVRASTAADVQKICDSPFALMQEDVTLGWNQIAIRKGQELRLAMLRLPTRFSHTHIAEIPATHGDADYRTEWLTYEQLAAEWDALANNYPWLVTKKAIGLTRENRTIYAYRVFRPETADVVQPPKSILILGDTHAREWMSPSVVLHLGKMLTQELATADNQLTAKLADKVAVWFVPVFNIDGYLYSWTPGNRMWRKNRRNNGTSYGVDLNRNYEKGWGGAGSSGTPSSDTYRGPSAASEPEIQAIRSFSLSLPNILGVIDYHSYAGQMLWPWSYTTAAPPPAAVTMFSNVANAVRSAILPVNGNNYVVGQGSTTLYVASGTSKDWYYDRFLCPSYTIEVAGTSFDPPTSTITPTQDDNWAGFKAFIGAVAP